MGQTIFQNHNSYNSIRQLAENLILLYAKNLTSWKVLSK